jgi:hypothetical protein
MARLPRQDQARMQLSIKALAEDPRPAGCRPVELGRAGMVRLRVGDYRVIYLVLDDAVALGFDSTLVALDREQRQRVVPVIPSCLPAKALGDAGS